jgi:hypothetical protein
MSTSAQPGQAFPHRVIGRLAVGGTAGLMLLFGMAAPAAAASLPSCASVSHDVGWANQTVYVKNNCSYDLTVRVIKVGPVANPCFVVPARQKVGWRWARMWNYIMTERC